MPEKQINTSIRIHEHLEFFAKTDVGEKRTENQDRFGQVIKPNFKIFIVADGMGGANGGATASQMTVDHLSEKFSELDEITPQDIYRITTEANEKIFNLSIEQRHLAGMGSTCVMLIFTEQQTYIVNIGDSRAYLIRGKEISQLTEDHTLVNELLKAGIITAEQAEDHPVSHMLTRCLGPSLKVEIDCFLEKPGGFKDDCYFLCSDGLYNLISDHEIRKIISNNTPEAACHKLISVVNERGGTDNITISIIKVKDSPFDIVADKIHYHLVPISFKDMPGYFEEESFERVLLRHSAAFDRYGVDFQQEKSAKNNWRNLSFVLALLAIITSSIYFFDPNFLKKDIASEGVEHPPVGHIPEDVQVDEFSELSSNEVSQARVAKIAERYESALSSESEFQALIDREETLEADFLILNSALSTKKAELIGLNKQLSFWYGLRKKLELNGAMSLSEELSAVSEEIKSKQIVFQDASWEYLQNLNQFQANPENIKLKEIVENQLNIRKTSMKELEISVYSLIHEKVNFYSREIADLINKISEESYDLNYLITEIDLLASLRGLDYQQDYQQIKAIIEKKLAPSTTPIE